jgi:anti-sigma regulatory factor (Ser/Thr protein kinase)
MTQAGGPSGSRVGDRGAVALLCGPRLDLEVPGRTDAVAGARHAVIEHLAQWGVPATIVDDMELVTSELVTNAIVHAGASEVGVSVDLSDTIELVVTNAGSVHAIPDIDDWRPAPPQSPSRRGLAIVRRLCDTVAVAQEGGRAVITCRRGLPDRGAIA